MHSDPVLVNRLAAFLSNRLEPKVMFGGQCWMRDGNICVGVYREYLIVRLGAQKFAQLATQYEDLRAMDITGRPMKGWGMMNGAACDEPTFAHLVRESEAFVCTLPAKPKK